MTTTPGAKAQPRVPNSATAAPTFGGDLTKVADYAALFGNYIIGTSGQRSTFSHPDWPDLDEPWDGLVWYETDTASTKRYQASTSSWREILFDSGWVPIGSLGSSFVAGWSGVADVGYPPAGFRLLNGVVHLRGIAVKSGLIAADDAALILPASTRPSTSRQMTVLQGSDIKAAKVSSDGTLRMLVAGQNSVILIGSYAI